VKTKKFHLFMQLLCLFIQTGLSAKPKIIGLIQARNESAIIAQCLKALALYTDSIVYLDDVSTDNTLEIVKSLSEECNIEKIITKDTWYRNANFDRNKLLQTGRELGGTHFIVIDADEMFTANCLKNNMLKKRILALKPGEKLKLNWIQLWKSLDYYRFDDSVWTNNYKDFIFCDDKKCFYERTFIHIRRTPENLTGKVRTIEGYEYGMMHFQFVNWKNLLIKGAWYRCLERIRLPEKSDEEINRRYAPRTNEKNLGLKAASSFWFKGYNFFNPTVFNIPDSWRKKQVLQWFKEYGQDHFAGLDIWNIDWSA